MPASAQPTFSCRRTSVFSFDPSICGQRSDDPSDDPASSWHDPDDLSDRLNVARQRLDVFTLVSSRMSLEMVVRSMETIVRWLGLDRLLLETAVSRPAPDRSLMETIVRCLKTAVWQNGFEITSHRSFDGNDRSLDGNGRSFDGKGRSSPRSAPSQAPSDGALERGDRDEPRDVVPSTTKPVALLHDHRSWPTNRSPELRKHPPELTNLLGWPSRPGEAMKGLANRRTIHAAATKASAFRAIVITGSVPS